MPLEESSGYRSRSTLGSVVAGAALGLVLGVIANLLAVLSSGAGHGDYAAARMLFPASMLLTFVEGSIGELSIAVALLQFPFYGGLMGWSVARGTYLSALVVGALHLVGVIFCFSGALPYYS